MFTEPKIITNADLTSRSYISYYYNGERYREYNAKKLNLSISPNYAKSIKDRGKLLEDLRYEFSKALRSGWSPIIIDQVEVQTLQDALGTILESKLSKDYSKTYKRDLQKVYNQFIAYVPARQLLLAPTELPLSTLENFLDQFKSSNRHYMNKRGNISVFFSELLRKQLILRNPINQTPRAKAKSVLHEVFSKEELTGVLNYLKENYSNLHLCCLLTYGCFLRPHREIRLLKLAHFHNDLTEIHLSGQENKSGRIRTVFVPNYIREELNFRLGKLVDPDANIFTLTGQPFNDDYFKTQWSRAKTEMLKLGLIRSHQTLYSFRHSSAVNVYKKTKDLHVIQQLLGHSDMIVTMNYLRGLGATSNDHLKSIMPEI